VGCLRRHAMRAYVGFATDKRGDNNSRELASTPTYARSLLSLVLRELELFLAPFLTP